MLKISMLFYLSLSLPPFFFYTITVAFTKGPQPLVGCYSIFKHHSAKSQPPHRPALHTCNKLSSSEMTETSWTEAGQGHFNESRLINIFSFVWLDPQSFYIQSMQCVSQRTSSKPCQLWAYCYCSSYLPADDWCYAILFYNSSRQNL